MTTKDSYFISVSSGTTAATGSFCSAAKTRWYFTTWTGLCVILFYILSEEKIFTVLVILCDKKEPCCSVISLSVGHVSTTDGIELLMLFPSSF